MSRLAPFFGLLLVALTGCAASQKNVTNTATNCDYSTPPGEMQMTYETKESVESVRNNDMAQSMRYNAEKRPSKGAVHAAVN